MARSDKSPFRREIVVTSSGYVGDSNGFYVPDIMSLHVDSSVENTGFFVEGRTSVKTKWETIHLDGEKKDIDIRAWEYVRVSVTLPTSAISATIVLFGYGIPVDRKEIIAISSKKDMDLNIENNNNLKQILTELQKLNMYMSIITGDKL